MSEDAKRPGFVAFVSTLRIHMNNTAHITFGAFDPPCIDTG